MFRVHEQEHGSGERLGVVTTAGLLAFSLAFGLAIQRQKLGRTEVRLGDRLVVEGSPLSFRSPKGWKREDDLVGLGVVAVLGSEEYKLVVARKEGPWGSAWTAAERFLASFSRGPSTQMGRLEWTRLGELSAVQLTIGGFSQRAAIGPMGELYALELQTLVPLEGQARRVLNKIADTVEWSEPGLAGSIDQLSPQPGLHFEVPKPAVFVQQAEGSTGRVEVLAGAGGQSSWALSAVRTNLVAGRTVADLMEDSLVSMDWEDVRATSVPAGKDREAMRCRKENEDVLIEHWTVRVGETDAVLVELKTDRSEAATAEAICRRVAETLGISPEVPEAALAKSITLGEGYVEEIRRKGLSHWWGPGAVEQWYVGWVNGEPVYWMCERRRPLTGPAAGSYRVEQIYQRRLSAGQIGTSHEVHWTIDGQGLVTDGPSDAQPGYVGPGAKDIAAFLAAKKGGADLVTLFSSLQKAPARQHASFCRALPPLENEETGKREYRVSVRDDYSPSEAVLVFDGSGRLVREEHGQLVFKLSSEAEAKKTLGSRRLRIRTRSR